MSAGLQTRRRSIPVSCLKAKAPQGLWAPCSRTQAQGTSCPHAPAGQAQSGCGQTLPPLAWTCDTAGLGLQTTQSNGNVITCCFLVAQLWHEGTGSLELGLKLSKEKL